MEIQSVKSPQSQSVSHIPQQIPQYVQPQVQEVKSKGFMNKLLYTFKRESSNSWFLYSLFGTPLLVGFGLYKSHPKILMKKNEETQEDEVNITKLIVAAIILSLLIHIIYLIIKMKSN